MNRPLLIYVHVPFCSSKCHFCDWVQQIPAGELRARRTSPMRIRYVEALQEQIRHVGCRLRYKGFTPRILYFGGGTASILEADELLPILTALRTEFDMEDLEEATMECSPETLTLEKLQFYWEQGFRRLSIGLQSLSERRLRTIGRSHTADQGVRAVELARQAGFRDINVDLICGFPEETLQEVHCSVEQAAQLPVSHFSLYPYRPTHGTTMRSQVARGTAGVIRLTEQREAYELGSNILTVAGYDEYALSHFGYRRCRSDLAYFRLEMDWVGFGSGATSLLEHQFLATERGQLGRFLQNPLDFDEACPAGSPAVTPRLLYQALSTWEGISPALWRQRTGLSLSAALQQPELRGLRDFFLRSGGLIEDAQGMRIRRDCLSHAFIELQYLNSPSYEPNESARLAFAGY